MSIDETLPGQSRSHTNADIDELSTLTIAQIRERTAQWSSDDPGWAALEKDRRVGVRHLVVERRRRDLREQAESERRVKLLYFERRLWEQGASLIAGVDEAGRGCLAGPVVAGAVVLAPDCVISGLDDSKKLSPSRREGLFAELTEHAVYVGVGQVEAEEIDRLNILQASLKAMRLALEDLGVVPDRVLIDGHMPAKSPYPEQAIIDGDARSLSIAAASIIAKVTRDRLMCDYAGLYPEYGFAGHKGYGSAEHMAALTAHGPCPLHRRSFGPVADLLQEPRSELFLSFEEGIYDSVNLAELERIAALVKEAADQIGAGELAGLREIYREQQHKLGDIGLRGEAEAAAYLQGLGYEVLQRRYRAAGGEVDLVAKDGEELVFVEVKTSRRSSHPERRVDRAKRRRLTRVARHYLQHHAADDTACRFDVLAVSLQEQGAATEHMQNAFLPLD